MRIRLSRVRTTLGFSVALALALAPSIAGAQPPLRAVSFATGFSRPLDFVQDPSDPTVQYVVEQGGVIRVLVGGVVQGTPFLNITPQVASSGEQGLLGLAFPSNYASSRRFYVFFTQAGTGDVIVARFLRSSANPLVADPSSRFDLVWSTNTPYIEHSEFGNHNGGDLSFGPDGYLYISVGDGGGGNDRDNNAQNLQSLLGKILRIDVSGSAPNGFVVPTSNPFIGRGRPEIWSLGLRNPWRFTFDALTGAMLIGDVGQNAWEEIDFEPPATGGRNYGWRNREGRHDRIQTVPPTVLPLTEPIHEYDHATGSSVTGGVVYRGLTLGPSYNGRYFFADYVSRRIWSMGINQSTGQMTDLREHTSELGTIGNLSAFGVDAAGEIYLVNHTGGQIFRVTGAAPVVVLDTVNSSAAGLEISGWSIDRRALADSGVDAVHVYAYPSAGSGPVFMGAFTPPFLARSDIAALFGSQFLRSGFRISSFQWIPPGPATVAVYARSSVTGLFEGVAARTVTIVPRRDRVSVLDQYPGSSVMQPFNISGWAFDRGVTGAPSNLGTGVNAVAVDLYTQAGAFVQTVPAAYGLSRPDVAAAFGARFQNSGFSATVMDLRPGVYFARVRYFMILANEWDVVTITTFTVNPGPMLSIDTPQGGSTGSRSFTVAGWAIDLRSTSGPGVDVVHVWAYPTSGGSPVFAGAPIYGLPRADVGAAFGNARFNNSGYRLTVTSLGPGTYDLVVWARSTVSSSFAINRVVRVTVP
jgi:glucose/arabinose dehydrogenase